MTTPRIYVASLSDYNAGRLHGVWIDATDDIDDIETQVHAMLAASREQPAEDFAIHDYEGFMGLRLSESTSLTEASEMALMLEEHGEAWFAYVDLVGDHYATQEGFEAAFLGRWSSREAWAEEALSPLMEQVPDELQGYIDLDGYARGLESGDMAFIDASDGTVFAFNRL